MGAFYYLGRSVPLGLVTLARLFDVVMILCRRQNCVGQHAAWPEEDRFRVCVADATVLYRRLNATLVSSFHHPQLVTATYGTAFDYCRWKLDQAVARASRDAPERAVDLQRRLRTDRRNVTYLVLEEDYRWLADGAPLYGSQKLPPSDPERGAKAFEALSAFVERGAWDVIRFGYNPQPWIFKAPNGSHSAFGAKNEPFVPEPNYKCSHACFCEPDALSGGALCANRGCDVVSTVAQAFSGHGARRMAEFFDDMVPTFQRTGKCREPITYMGGRRRTCAVDLYLSKGAALERVYYHVPGLIADSTRNLSATTEYTWKPSMVTRMRHFARVCVKPRRNVSTTEHRRRRQKRRRTRWWAPPRAGGRRSWRLFPSTSARAEAR